MMLDRVAVTSKRPAEVIELWPDLSRPLRFIGLAGMHHRLSSRNE